MRDGENTAGDTQCDQGVWSVAGQLSRVETFLLRAAFHGDDAVVAVDELVARVGVRQHQVLVAHARVI